MEEIKSKVNVTVVVPSYEPDEKLEGVIRSLMDAGFTDIIVVNDGSSPENLKYFPEEGSIPGYVLLSHPENRGKGAALKTGFAYYLEHTPVDSIGVVAVDGDGQHTTEDVIKLCKALEAEPDKVILGVRDFSQHQVPLRSKIGNRITRCVFHLFCGIRITDTQTGLRAVPRGCVADLLKISGDRYEYETNMLLDAKNYHIKFREVQIQTVYIENNQTSHFRTFRDAVRIYALIIKYMSSSILSAAIDEIAFFVFTAAFGAMLGDYSVFACTAAARIISASVNFAFNRRIFGSGDKMVRALGKYIVASSLTMCLSAIIVHLLKTLIGVEAAILQTCLKIIVDIILFFLNFRVQKMWVFKK